LVVAATLGVFTELGAGAFGGFLEAIADDGPAAGHGPDEAP
jgi:hypothetical protein